MDDDNETERNIFSDPESEWVRRDSFNSTTDSDDLEPESDQKYALNTSVYTVTHPE